MYSWPVVVPLSFYVQFNDSGLLGVRCVNRGCYIWRAVLDASAVNGYTKSYHKNKRGFRYSFPQYDSPGLCWLDTCLEFMLKRNVTYWVDETLAFRRYAEDRSKQWPMHRLTITLRVKENSQLWHWYIANDRKWQGNGWRRHPRSNHWSTTRTAYGTTPFVTKGPSWRLTQVECLYNDSYGCEAWIFIGQTTRVVCPIALERNHPTKNDVVRSSPQQKQHFDFRAVNEVIWKTTRTALGWVARLSVRFVYRRKAKQNRNERKTKMEEILSVRAMRGSAYLDEVSG